MKGGVKAFLVLTNLRVWHEVEGGGRYDLTSLAVDEVQWAQAAPLGDRRDPGRARDHRRDRGWERCDRRAAGAAAIGG
jgi:hypothetical protein